MKRGGEKGDNVEEKMKKGEGKGRIDVTVKSTGA
jgi:hypothetical protein